VSKLQAVRARIGLIIPSSNRLTESQMHRYAPRGVEVHVTRLRMTGPNHVPLPELVPRIEEATRALADAQCDVVLFHCTASSMEAGLSGERQVIEAMRSAAAALVGTTAGASLAALRALDLHRIGLFSPYVAATHAHESAFLAEAGFEVVSGRGLGLSGGDEYITVPAAEWLRIAAEETPADAEGVFLSCTNVHTSEIIQPLESLIGRPVLTSNQAVLWYALRVCGLDDVVPELGSLFACGIDESVDLSAASGGATIGRSS
jgi:maleate isomerase